MRLSGDSDVVPLGTHHQSLRLGRGASCLLILLYVGALSRVSFIKCALQSRSFASKVAARKKVS